MAIRGLWRSPQSAHQGVRAVAWAVLANVVAGEGGDLLTDVVNDVPRDELVYFATLPGVPAPRNQFHQRDHREGWGCEKARDEIESFALPAQDVDEHARVKQHQS